MIMIMALAYHVSPCLLAPNAQEAKSKQSAARTPLPLLDDNSKPRYMQVLHMRSSPPLSILSPPPLSILTLQYANELPYAIHL